MQKFDSCPRPADSMTLAALGTSVEVSVGGFGADDFASNVAATWSMSRDLVRPGLPPAASVRVCLAEESEPAQRGHVHVDNPARALHLLSQEVTMAAITARIGDLLMFHGAALSNDDGDTLAVVAESGTGKTTFVRTHGPGRHYLSDETVGVSPDGRIVAHPKPLSVIGNAGRLIKSQVCVTEFGMLPPLDDAHLSTVWLLDRQPDPTPPTLAPVEPLEAIMVLAPQISSLSALPEPLHLLHGVLEAVGGLRRMTYSEASDLEEFIDAELGAPA